jgi:excisionase family DNA binding protein
MREKRTTLTVQEVADLKGVDSRTVRGWIQRGLIEAEQINPRLWLVDAESVKDFQPPKSGRPSIKAASKKGSKK